METHKNESQINDKKLELEHEKIQLDKDRLKIDKFKAWWTGISILIPLLVVALTLSFNSWQQIRNSQSEFELQAARLIIDAKGPSAAKAKARALAALFPFRLPKSFAKFADEFEPEQYSGPSVTAKKELMSMIVAEPERKEEIVSIWLKIFPGDVWAKDLLK